MKRGIHLSVVACLAVCGCFSCFAQSVDAGPLSAKAPDSGRNPESAVPTAHLEFESGKPIAGVTASPALVMPIECSSNGEAEIQMLQPPDFRRIVMYLVGPSSAREVSLGDVPGLINPRPMEVYISDSIVGVLVDAQRRSSDPSTPPTYGEFLAEFGTDGQFKSLADLKPLGRFLHFAILPSGDVVFLEYDAANEVVRLTLRDSDGTLKLQIPVPSELAGVLPSQNTVSLPRANGNNMPPADQERFKDMGLLSSARFTGFGDKVLLWIPDHRDVIEIGNGGAIRTVTVHYPEGYSLDGLVPTTDRWLVRFRRNGVPRSGADLSPATKNLVLYEVSSSDGSLRRMLDTGATPDWTACERDGILTVFKTDDKQHLIPLTADLGR